MWTIIMLGWQLWSSSEGLGSNMLLLEKVRKKVDILKMLLTVKTYSGIPPLAEKSWGNCNICRNHDEIKSISFFWTTLYVYFKPTSESANVLAYWSLMIGINHFFILYWLFDIQSDGSIISLLHETGLYCIHIMVLYYCEGNSAVSHMNSTNLVGSIHQWHPEISNDQTGIPAWTMLTHEQCHRRRPFPYQCSVQLV